MRKALIAAFALCSALAQLQPRLEFEVASVKPSKTGITGPGAIDDGIRGNRFMATNVTTRRLIMRAYEIADWQISGRSGSTVLATMLTRSRSVPLTANRLT